MTGLVSFESNKRRRRTTLTFLFVRSSEWHRRVSTCWSLPMRSGRKGRNKGYEKNKDPSYSRRSLGRSNAYKSKESEFYVSQFYIVAD